MTKPHLLSLVIALPLLAGGTACSRHVFEAMPSAPEEVLAFKLRRLKPGALVQIGSAGDHWTEGRVLLSSGDSVVVATERGPIAIPASAVNIVRQRRPGAATTVGQEAGGAALLGAALTGLIYLAGSLSDSPEDDFDVPAVAAYLIGRGALAGALFGGVIAASSPEWIQVYPVPAGARP